MFQTIVQLFTFSDLLLESFLATLFVVFVSGSVATLFGLPLALALFVTKKGQFLENAFVYRALDIVVSIGRSVPFIILMVAVIPLTRFIVGTSIGTAAAIVPLSIAAIPFFARIVEAKIAELDNGLIEAALAMGSTPWQIVRYVVLAESFPGIVNAITILLVSLTEYSAMAGLIGGSGLGNMAIQWGYYRFDMVVMLQAVIALIILVQVIQYSGNSLYKKLTLRSR